MFTPFRARVTIAIIVMVAGSALAGCFSPEDGITLPSAAWYAADQIELNASTTQGMPSFAAVLPILVDNPTEFQGQDSGLRLQNGSTQYLLVQPDGQRYFDFIRPAGYTPLYEWRHQDKAEGIDDGECIDSTERHPCPPREGQSQRLELSIPRTPTAPNNIPSGEWFLVVFSHQITNFSLQLTFNAPIAINGWQVVNATSGTFGVGAYDAERQEWERCVTSSACGVIEGGRFEFGDQPFRFNTVTVSLLIRNQANVSVCIEGSGLAGDGVCHALEAEPTAVSVVPVPGEVQMDSLIVNRLDTGPFTYASVDADSNPLFERALFNARGTYWSVDLPSGSAFEP